MAYQEEHGAASLNADSASSPASRHTKLNAGKRALWLVLVLLAAINIAVGIADFGILNGNESLYVESAREMLHSGNWGVPTLNGLPYIEKPPLMDWLLLGVFRIGGVGEATARLVPLGASILAAVALTRFASLLRIGGAPETAAYIYLTSLGVVLMSSVAMPDALFNGLFGIGCAAFAAALGTRSRNLVRWSALALGLASLTKGFLPIALFALILAAYALSRRARFKLVMDLLRDPLAWALLFLPVLAWVVAAEISLPGAAKRFIVDEHILRFLGMREPDDYYSGSIFYYAPRLLLFAFPWVGVLVFGWLAQRREAADGRQDMRHFFWACLWAPFVFFSFSQAKANYYVTLCLPVMALLTSDYLRILLRKTQRAWLLMAIVVPTLLLLILQAYRVWAISTGRAPRLLSHPDGSFPMTTAGILVTCLLLVGLAQSRWQKIAGAGLGLLIVPLTLQLHHLAVAAGPQISARHMAAYIQRNFPDEPVMLYQDYEAYGALPIYLNRNIPVIDSRSNDLYFGAKLRPKDRFLTSESAVLSLERALIVVLDEREEAFRRSSLWSRSRPLRSYGKAVLYELVPTSGARGGNSAGTIVP